MQAETSIDVLVLGSGPGALAIASALSKEKLRVEVLSSNDHQRNEQTFYNSSDNRFLLPQVAISSQE